MTPSLTITDRESGRAYNVPEDLHEFVDTVFGTKNSQFSNERLYLHGKTWGVSGRQLYQHQRDDFEFALDPNRFTVSFPNTLTKEVVREVLKEEFRTILKYTEELDDENDFDEQTWRVIVQETLGSIFTRFNLNLEETTNGN